jgi:hypothetical protein
MKIKPQEVWKIHQTEASNPNQLNLTKISGGFISVDRIEALIKNSALIRTMILPIISRKN